MVYSDNVLNVSSTAPTTFELDDDEEEEEIELEMMDISIQPPATTTSVQRPPRPLFRDNVDSNDENEEEEEEEESTFVDEYTHPYHPKPLSSSSYSPFFSKSMKRSSCILSWRMFLVAVAVLSLLVILTTTSIRVKNNNNNNKDQNPTSSGGNSETSAILDEKVNPTTSTNNPINNVENHKDDDDFNDDDVDDDVDINEHDEEIEEAEEVLVDDDFNDDYNDDDVDINEHEEEIEEAEEVLVEEEEEEEKQPEEQPDETDNMNDDHDSDYNVGSTQWFALKTGNARVDAAYQLAMDELHQNIVDHDGSQSQQQQSVSDPSYYIAGNAWTELWTRDTAYAIELGAGLVAPQVSMTSLRKCTETALLYRYDDTTGEIDDSSSRQNETVWYQDVCSHFGGWPNLSDAIVGARGAWYLYLYTGNTTFLEWAYQTTVSSLKRAEQEHVKKHGLFHGCSSFMESNSGYPSKYHDQGKLVGKTKALSTNMLYWNGYYLASRMGEILMINSNTVRHHANQADKLKQNIREQFWNKEKGYYAYFLDENDVAVEQMEGLGEALVLLSEQFEESEHRVRSILDHTYRTELGIACLWPRFEYDGPFDDATLNDDDHVSHRYHNGRIWPFVSSYFAIAAARKGRMDIFAQHMLHIIDLSEQHNTFAEFYELDKTFPPQRKRQLWSDTGYLGMVYQGLFGMIFEVNGIVFAPSKPTPMNFLKMNDKISLLNVKYRHAVLDVHVTGFGNEIASFMVNGQIQEIPKLDATAKGHQVIEIHVRQL